jgi:hypothetical protein
MSLFYASILSPPSLISLARHSSRARGIWLRALLLSADVCWLSAPSALAQDAPAIRVEAHEVLVPVRAFSRNAYEVPNLTAADFRLFEDGQEQRIQKVISVRVYDKTFNDNMGVEEEWARTPKGKWVTFRDTTLGIVSPAYVHLIAYVPPSSKPGSCHRIKVKLNPRDTRGNRFVSARAEFDHEIHRAQVDRRDLQMSYRTEYCNTEHASYDPLNGTKLSKQMESYVAAENAKAAGLSVQASTFYPESGVAQTHIALDFTPIGYHPGIPSFDVALLGMIFNQDRSLATRFSDSTQAGCLFVQHPTVETYQLCQEGIPNHYETQVSLPSGKYDLRVVLDYGGQLRRAQVPLVVDSFDATHLAMSGIALCKRFHKRSGPEQTSVPTMRYEFVPLVSLGIEFTPAGDTRFKKREPTIVYFEAYEPLLADRGSADVLFEARIFDAKTGERKDDTGLLNARPWVRAGNPVIPIATKFPVDNLPPGIYRLEVQVSDSAGNHTGWRTTSFTIE